MNARAYMAFVAEVGCVLCKRIGWMQQTRTCVHHIRTGMGAGQRASDWLTVALCEDCHAGKTGIHGDKSRLRQAKCDELDLLADTIAAVHNRRD